MKRSLLIRIGGAFAVGLGMALSVTSPMAQNTVLKGAQVTESALIDALMIDAPQSAEGVTRGFRPATAGPAAPRKPAGPGRANLLITFGTDSADLAPDAQKALDAVARALSSDALAGFSFRVEGHADARGESARNLDLSRQRAEAVTKYLVTAHGILPERLVPEGKGSAEPLNKARIDAPENRRVTIVTQRN
jgi:OmpA-OmpF porin, OOP family